jgi:hypothetical protein
MSLVKVPPKSLPWLLVIFGAAGIFGLVGLMTQNHIWPFDKKDEPPPVRPAATAPAGNPPPAAPTTPPSP